MSDVRIRAARGLIASTVRSAAKEARRHRHDAGVHARNAEDEKARAAESDSSALECEAEVNQITDALSILP